MVVEQQQRAATGASPLLHVAGWWAGPKENVAMAPAKVVSKQDACKHK